MASFKKAQMSLGVIFKNLKPQYINRCLKRFKAYVEDESSDDLWVGGWSATAELEVRGSSPSWCLNPAYI